MFALPRNQLGDLALYSAEAWEGIIHLLGTVFGIDAYIC